MADYATLLASLREPADPAGLAFAGVMAMASSRAAPYDVPIAGLGRASLARLLALHFRDAKLPDLLEPLPLDDSLPDGRGDEFCDLLELLQAYARDESDNCRWVALALATGSMGQNHLWQDMGLPNRRVLSRLIETWFPGLFARNVGDMKWKKFFYRQLCERAEVLICKSPSCGVCVDYQQCFAPEAPAPTLFNCADTGQVSPVPILSPAGNSPRFDLRSAPDSS